MVLDTLDVCFLTDVEGEGLGEGSGVGHRAVCTHTGVGKGSLGQISCNSPNKAAATYVVTLVLRGGASTDLRACVQLSMAPVDYASVNISWSGPSGCPLHLQAVLESTLAGLNPAVAIGGMTCETVVEAATDAALEVSMVCAWTTATRAEAARMYADTMMAGSGGREEVSGRSRGLLSMPKVNWCSE